MPWPTLQQHDRGLNVRAAQALLEDHGYVVPFDGRFRWKTVAAVKAFQREHGLKPTGVVQQATWVRLVVTMKVGDTGNCVRVIQRKLSFLGDVKIDGVFGPKTRSAVKQFQHDEGLVESGAVGRFTWKHLLFLSPSCLTGLCDE
jgi:peptidoglycan hydrolase-like protein with peptidoglycan-binding domain